MKTNRILQISVLAVMLVVSVAGAPRPTAALAAHTQSPAGPPPVVADKTVSQSQAIWGDTLTYTITLTNTSVVSPAATVLTDTLPLSLAFQPNSLSASEGSFTQTAQVINWSGVITTSGVITLSFQAKVVQPGTTIHNQAAFSSDLGSGQSPIATTAVGAPRLFLPVALFTLPPTGIFGTVTNNGSPAAGIPLQLRFYDGANWSTAASLSTAGDGSYLFHPAALGPGQKYYVLFRNITDPSLLYVWGTRQLTSFQPTDSDDLGAFDIANIELNAPAAGATVNLPYNFQWTPRPATHSDNYEFDMTVPNPSQNPFFYTNPPLGYVGSFVLNHLPPGFNTNTDYIWFMWVYDTQGGYGISYWSWYVRFGNSGSAQTHLPNSARLATASVAPALREQK